MGDTLGELKIKVVQGRKLVIRDFRSSDPYVTLKLGNQVVPCFFEIIPKDHARMLPNDCYQAEKTKVINSCLNPVWNEEFTFPLSQPDGVLKLKVFDRDRFKVDDKMGYADLDLRPLMSAARLSQIVGISSDGSVLRKVIPESDNCLAVDSSIVFDNGELVQDVWLRLRDVESGEIELKINFRYLSSLQK